MSEPNQPITYRRKKKRKEWEESHEDFFFPGVPVFILTELQQQLGLEIVASPRKRLNGGVESIVDGERFVVEQCLAADDDEGKDLVRKDGTTLVSVDSLNNKHVLLCCFCVPLYGAGLAVPHARSISSLCSELATSNFAKECEMVIVAKMAPKWADNKAAFDHFFKAFPDSCLTVPFHHKNRINRICESLNLRSFYPCSLLVSQDRKVLQTDLEHVWSYGVEAFPFSNERLRAVEENDKRLMSGSSSSPLATVLGLDQLPSDRRLRDAVTGLDGMPISELENKDVVLYLCCKGDLLDSLSKVYHYCEKKGSGFEIVIVVVWFPGVTGLGKYEFVRLMTSAFQLRGLSCLDLPVVSDSVVRRLFRICGDMTHNTMSDKLLTMGADDIVQRVIMSIQSQISRELLQATFKGKQVFMYHTAVENDPPWSRRKKIKGKAGDRHGHRETRKELIQRWRELDLKHKEAYDKKWEISLPHGKYFFPCVPPFKLYYLRQQLGLEAAPPFRKRPKRDSHVELALASSSSTDLDPLTMWNLSSPHAYVVGRDNEMGFVLEEGEPYPRESIVVGAPFNIENCLVDDDDEGPDLVRKDGTTLVPVDSLRNKHVMLCWFYAPLYWAIDAVQYAHAISSLCSDIATLKRKGELKEECEMVIVAKMTPYWADNKAAFDHFFTAFPDSCLTVPFHHKKRIDRIFRYVNQRMFIPQSLIVDPDRKVLRKGLHNGWTFGVKGGYPFSEERLKAVEERDKRLLSGTSTRPLATLLGLDQLPPDSRLQDVVTGQERISISELETKDVVVYLCCEGDLFHGFSEVYKRFKEEKRGFEVVVVWFPDITGLRNDEFIQLMTDAFRREELPFLVLPFDDNLVVARTLIRIRGDNIFFDTMGDKLLTVGAKGAYVNRNAGVFWDHLSKRFSLAGFN